MCHYHIAHVPVLATLSSVCKSVRAVALAFHTAVLGLSPGRHAPGLAVCCCASWETAGDGTTPQTPAPHVETLLGIAWQLQPGPAVAVADASGTNQTSVCLCLSSK